MKQSILSDLIVSITAAETLNCLYSAHV